MAKKIFAFCGLLAGLSLTILYGANAQELTVRNQRDVVFMDPAYITTSSDYTIAVNIYSALLRFNLKTMEPEPDLAKSWEISSDGLTYTFYLRDDVFWHKGYGKFTAKDVKYSFDRIMDPKTRSRYRSDFVNVKEVETVGANTVKIHFKTPDMSFVRKVLYYRPGYIVNQKAIETLGSNYNSGPIGTGPFIFDRWDPGSKVVLTANKDYFLGAPKLNKITFLVINEEAVTQMALETGDLDIAAFSSLENLEAIKGGAQVQSGRLIFKNETPLRISYLVMNNCRKPFDDIRIRQAVHHGINKDSLIAAAYSGLAKKAANFLNPGYFAYKSDVKVYDYNPGKAKKLLAEAGFPNGFETNLLYYATEPWKSHAPVIQDQLRQIGVRIKLNMVDRATVEQLRQKGNFDLLSANLSRPPDPDIVFSTYFHSANIPYPNLTCYKNKEVDDLIMLGNRERNTDRRKKIYHRIQDIIAEETPAVPIDYGSDFVVHKPRVKGFVYSPLADYVLHDVSIEGKK
jgi:peptide/nickel transport system substrate-binding protein